MVLIFSTALNLGLLRSCKRILRGRWVKTTTDGWTNRHQMDIHLVKVCNDLVEEAKALQAVVVDAALVVKLLEEMRHGREHHANTLARLTVQVLKHTHTHNQYYHRKLTHIIFNLEAFVAYILRYIGG